MRVFGRGTKKKKEKKRDCEAGPCRLCCVRESVPCCLHMRMSVHRLLPSGSRTPPWRVLCIRLQLSSPQRDQRTPSHAHSFSIVSLPFRPSFSSFPLHSFFKLTHHFHFFLFLSLSFPQISFIHPLLQSDTMAQLQRLLSRAPQPSELQSQVPTTYYKPPAVAFKDSISHPINVSWIIPPWVSALLQQDMKVPKFGSSIHFEGHEKDETGLTPFTSIFDFAQQQAAALKKEGPEGSISRAKKFYPDWRPRGNLGLSSCPGKKVRLDGPINGRAKIVRDLDMDFDRLHKLGFTRVIW